ncbi:unnamed protein product [Amoebophrya sp. A25]|nr:unnamed protein product [Amoebophrya sp. A25]|eukprot:GSA25T00016785001.1
MKASGQPPKPGEAGFYDPEMAQMKAGPQPGEPQAAPSRFWLYLFNVLVPPMIVFTCIFLLCSVGRYLQPSSIYMVLFAEILIFGMPSLYYVFIARRMYHTSALLVAALIFGLYQGEVIFRHEMLPVYAMRAMRERSGVNPATTPAESIQDTGTVYFAEGTVVEQGMGMSYKSEETYCVAPISLRGQTLVKQDYWAVGVDCCESGSPTFEGCLDHSGGGVSGLRVMFLEQLPFFQLAVEQSESEYNIRAGEKPMFFYIVKDPVAQGLKFEKRGTINRVRVCFEFLLVNVLIAPILTWALP